MRAADRAEIEAAGLVPRHVLMQLWRDSIDPKAALIDGEVAAAWGDAAPLLSSEGNPWLFTAPPADKVPVLFFRVAREQIADWLRIRRIIRARVVASYVCSLRLYRMLGFEVSDPFPLGPKGELFCEIVMGDR